MKELRIAAGYSQEALARQVGVSLQTVGTWERGVNIPSLEKAAKLAEVLRLSFKTMAASVGIDVSKIPDDCLQPGLPGSPELAEQSDKVTGESPDREELQPEPEPEPEPKPEQSAPAEEKKEAD